MKNVWSLIGKASFLFGFCVFYSCKGKEDNTAILEQIDEGLVQSNKQIRFTSNEILQAIVQKASDPNIAESAKELYQQAVLLQTKTTSAFSHIEGIGKLLKSNGSSGLFSKKVEEVYAKLDNYKREIMVLNKRMAEDLNDDIFIISKAVDSSQKVLSKLKENLLNKPALEAGAFLHQIQNNLAIDEQKAMYFLLYQTTPIIRNPGAVEAIVRQNAQILAAGNTLEITTGVGNFNRRSLVVVTINKKIVPLNERGVVVYRIKTTTKPGSYSIPVQIKFTDQDGNIQTRTIPVEYKTVSANLK